MVPSSELAGFKPEPSNLIYILIFLLPMWQEVACVAKNIQIDWQWPLSVNSAQAGRGRGGEWTTFPFYLPSRAKLTCTLKLRGQIRPSYLSSTLFFSVVQTKIFLPKPDQKCVHYCRDVSLWSLKKSPCP
jgi:hypothetical protein